MQKSELQVHRAPRFPDYRDWEADPKKVFSDLVKITKWLWQAKTDAETRLNLLEEKVEQQKGIRPLIRYMR